jgi:hypothetical protein
VEEAGHEEAVTEFDFEDFESVQGGDGATAKDEVPHVGLTKVEFGVGEWHGGFGFVATD